MERGTLHDAPNDDITLEDAIHIVFVHLRNIYGADTLRMTITDLPACLDASSVEELRHASQNLLEEKRDRVLACGECLWFTIQELRRDYRANDEQIGDEVRWIHGLLPLRFTKPAPVLFEPCTGVGSSSDEYLNDPIPIDTLERDWKEDKTKGYQYSRSGKKHWRDQQVEPTVKKKPGRKPGGKSGKQAADKGQGKKGRRGKKKHSESDEEDDDHEKEAEGIESEEESDAVETDCEQHTKRGKKTAAGEKSAAGKKTTGGSEDDH
ncbi:hypothetical protein MSAN_01274400 [Mycena sanguinolenta]|uniref:Uncharacterized protein n=1 Tax=Mycena sanguinolenta TaxID=230812 RepID=A0A8H7D2Q4_9AGAR|nr:hypothetical protein MSAN_01274400 [Mycena sanguinolenta]